jgi:thiol-disulfide isomerase/thioredoxin
MMLGTRGALVAALTMTMAAAGAQAAPERTLEVGKRIPPLGLRTPQNEMVRVEELAYPGPEKKFSPKRPLMVDFFRTDCEPCKRSLPELVALAEKHRAAGLEVVMVALLEQEQGREKLDAFLGPQKLPFKVVVDANDHFAKKYLGSTVSLPATFLVSREGILKKAKYDAKGSLEEHFGEDLSALLAEHAAARRN